MKTALVTGVAGGIGFCVAEKLTGEGFTVFGTDIVQENDRFSALKNFTYIQGNLALEADRKRAVETVISAAGKIGALVNVAGVAPKLRTGLLEMTEESYDFVMDINTKGTFFLTQLAAREMIKNKEQNGIRGYIVNISSMSAYTSSTSRGEYCISKAGVSMITKLFADALAEYGIPVNEIRPGIIATGMTDAVKTKYDKLIAEGLLPNARWGTPEDVANAVTVLCGGKLSYTTGQSLDVDGGFHLRRL